MLLRKRRREAPQEKIQEEIRNALDRIRPILRLEECGLRLSSFDAVSGAVVLDVNGDCPDCELSVETFLQGIETQLKLRVPQVTSVSFS